MHASLRRQWMSASIGVGLATLAASATSSCVYYHPVPAYQPAPSKFDRSWDAARAAADDLGVTITDVDRARGTMHGYKDASDVTITLWQQADGTCT